MNKNRKNNWLLCLLYGFGISFLIALFVLLGVQFMLFLLAGWKLPREVVVVYTSLFYGIVFFIARIGTRAKNRWKQITINEEDLEDETEIFTKKRSIISRIRSVLWILFAIFSVLWLTPTLVIYWTSPLHSNSIFTLFSFVFGFTASVIYFVVNTEKFLSITDRLIFFLGACSGPIIVIYFFNMDYSPFCKQ